MVALLERQMIFYTKQKSVKALIALTYFVLAAAVGHLRLHWFWSRGLWDLQELHSPELHPTVQSDYCHTPTYRTQAHAVIY